MKASAGRAILGGLAATPVMTVLMYTVAPLMGVKVDIAAMLGTILGGWNLGMLVHILNGGLIFPIVYSLLLYRFLFGPPVLRGISFGLGLWLVSELLIMPAFGAGLFSSHIGGVTALSAALIGHIVYGGLLGALCGGAEEGFRGVKVHKSRPVHLKGSDSQNSTIESAAAAACLNTPYRR